MKKVFLTPLFLLFLYSCSPDEETEAPTTENISTESNIFLSSDVNQLVKPFLISALETVMDIFEVEIPVEYYVLGEDIDAANELASIFCNRRLEDSIESFYNQGINQDPYSQCLEFMMFPNQSAASGIGEFRNWNDYDYKGSFEQRRGNYDSSAASAELVSEGTLGLIISSNSAVEGITSGF